MSLCRAKHGEDTCEVPCQGRKQSLLERVGGWGGDCSLLGPEVEDWLGFWLNDPWKPTPPPPLSPTLPSVQLSPMWAVSRVTEGFRT